jgi:hypothetical protein
VGVPVLSYDAAWGPGEQLASMRNGSGDEWSVTFTAAGTYLRGFDHESALNPFAQQPPGLAPGLLDRLPATLRGAADESAFTLEDLPLVTLALWRLSGEGYWSFGDGSVGPDGDDGARGSSTSWTVAPRPTAPSPRRTTSVSSMPPPWAWWWRGSH